MANAPKVEKTAGIVKQFIGDSFFLSNFAPVEIEDNGKVWASIEHAIAGRMCADNDIGEQYKSKIQKKEMGRQVQALVKDMLDAGKNEDFNYIESLIELTEKKFQIPAMKAKLKATGAKYLLNTTYWHDLTYGVCFCPTCREKEGHNALGELLMDIREKI